MLVLRIMTRGQPLSDVSCTATKHVGQPRRTRAKRTCVIIGCQRHCRTHAPKRLTRAAHTRTRICHVSNDSGVGGDHKYALRSSFVCIPTKPGSGNVHRQSQSLGRGSIICKIVARPLLGYSANAMRQYRCSGISCRRCAVHLYYIRSKGGLLVDNDKASTPAAASGKEL